MVFKRDKRISRLLIAGMMTHMCIDTTTRAAADLGFSCLLAHDACAARALTFIKKSIGGEDGKKPRAYS
jgi:nicotinamidase-related amidase